MRADRRDRGQGFDLEELNALTIEFESGTVLGLSLHEADLDSPTAGSYSVDGSGHDEEEF